MSESSPLRARVKQQILQTSRQPTPIPHLFFCIQGSVPTLPCNAALNSSQSHFMPLENAVADEDEAAAVLTVSFNLECGHPLAIPAWRDDKSQSSICLISKLLRHGATLHL
ncbi:hypothetical protein [Aquitalea magnusonii]|uniref:hypothetical protein n=1 Tax=Aquitalea magnusonii TaxID=332411 RepID=UPI0011AE8C8C|nr:hypothetical protein [Aquitalea magnusonii]